MNTYPDPEKWKPFLKLMSCSRDANVELQRGGRSGGRGSGRVPAQALAEQQVGILPLRQKPQGTGNTHLWPIPERFLDIHFKGVDQ